MDRRLTGQSIRDQHRLIPFYLGTLFLWILFVWENYKAKAHVPPQPRIVFCFAIISTGITAIVLRRLFYRFHNLKRREHGELRVAEVLDELRSHGYRVIHRIVRSGYDIDHAVVGPAGLFAVKTKFRGGYSENDFRNGSLYVGNHREENNPLGQAHGSAASIRKLVKEHTGIDVCVKRLIFVGDWTVNNGWHDTDTPGITASQLEPCFRNQDQPELTDAEIDLIGSHLEGCAKP